MKPTHLLLILPLIAIGILLYPIVVPRHTCQVSEDYWIIQEAQYIYAFQQIYFLETGQYANSWEYLGLDTTGLSLMYHWSFSALGDSLYLMEVTEKDALDREAGIKGWRLRRDGELEELAN